MALLLVVTQFAIPPIAEHVAANRLTENGGTANVSVSAFPALRLLFGDGDRFVASGEGLHLDLTQNDDNALERLDKFGEVSIRVTNSTAGPFEVKDFELSRASTTPYHVVAEAVTTPHDLLAFGADQLGFVGGLALRFGGNEALGSNRRARLPVKLDMQMQSEGGRAVVVAGGGTVAGIPTGPLAEIITAAIVVRL